MRHRLRILSLLTNLFRHAPCYCLPVHLFAFRLRLGKSYYMIDQYNPIVTARCNGKQQILSASGMLTLIFTASKNLFSEFFVDQRPQIRFAEPRQYSAVDEKRRGFRDAETLPVFPVSLDF